MDSNLANTQEASRETSKQETAETPFTINSEPKQNGDVNKDLMIKLRLGDQPLNALLDTGAAITVINVSVFSNCRKSRISGHFW